MSTAISAAVSMNVTNTVLAQVAAAMAAGTWAQVPGITGWAALAAGGSTGQMLPYCHYMPWNPVAKRVEFLGQDHGWGNIRYVRYDAASNALSFVGNIGTSEGHGYNHVQVNPFNGDLFFQAYGYQSNAFLWRYPISGSGWQPNFAQVNDWIQVANGWCWWSGALNGAGAQGALVCYSNFGSGKLCFYDPIANAWLPVIQNATTNTDGYQGIMAYNPSSNLAVYGGASGITRQIWRLNANRTITRLADAPKDFGVQRGHIVEEPTSGRFLLLAGDRTFYELDPSGGGTWVQLTGSRAPPANVAVPGGDTSNTTAVTCFRDHGVVGFWSPVVQRLDLYKHA